MSILTDQIYGGVLAEDASTEPMRAERKPFGNLPSKEGKQIALFSGFTYAKDEEAASAFENGAESEKNSPTDIRQLEDEVAFFNTTTYGTPDNFARLSKGQNTVLTNLARFVNNGDGSETATTWNNTEMKNSFSTGNGTRSQIFRPETETSEYDFTTGWKNELIGNGFDAGHKYEVRNVFIDQVSAEGNAESPVVAEGFNPVLLIDGVEVTIPDLNQDGILNMDDFHLFADAVSEGG
tara:strand:+ start:1433 stop:2143 length:711 start_codon:yes stop_codon:yes gene_type:complete